MSEDAVATAPPPPPPPPSVSPQKLIGTLAGFSALAGFLLVFAFEKTQPRIQAHREEVLRQTVLEVLRRPARVEALFLVGGALVTEPPAGTARESLERVFAGYDESGRRVGYALSAAEPGFADTVKVLFGYDPVTGKLLGIKILESKETPGLGDKINDPAFGKRFENAQAPLVGVAKGTADQPNEIDMITGATISSRTVIRIINRAIARIGPLLGTQPAEAQR